MIHTLPGDAAVAAIMPVVVSCQRCVQLKHLGGIAILELGVSTLTKSLPFGVAFSGFGDPIPWLVGLSFFFAKGFIKPGLENHVATTRFLFI
ncbi:hypothetical protein AHAS_Ahas11G0109500 [Arachis hypogaea]